MSDDRYSFISQRTIPEDKDPAYRHIAKDFSNAPKFIKDWADKSPKMNEFVRDVISYLSMNTTEQKKYLRGPEGPSQSYIDNYQLLKDNNLKLNANPAGLTIEQILAQDRHFHRTYVMNNVAGQIFARYPGMTQVLSSKKWEAKHHVLTKYGWPEFTKDFKKLGSITVGPEGAKHQGIGWGAEYEIPFTTIDQAANGIYDIDYWHVFMLSERMGKFGDERAWLGAYGEHTTNLGGYTFYGLHNWTNIQPGGTSTSHANVTGIGSAGTCTQGKADWDEGNILAKESLYDNKVFSPGPIVCVSTPGCGVEQYINDSAVGALKTCYEQIQNKWYRSNQIDSWWITDKLNNTDMSTSNQRIMWMKMTPNYIKRQIIYPLQRKAILNKRYSDDIAFAYITADLYTIYDGNAIVVETSDVTTTYSGWVENGLFMDNNTMGMKSGKTSEV